eukprot:15618205-Heterocapsa_arctica.AAC.1
MTAEAALIQERFRRRGPATRRYADDEYVSWTAEEWRAWRAGEWGGLAHPPPRKLTQAGTLAACLPAASPLQRALPELGSKSR